MILNIEYWINTKCDRYKIEKEANCYCCHQFLVVASIWLPLPLHNSYADCLAVRLGLAILKFCIILYTFMQSVVRWQVDEFHIVIGWFRVLQLGRTNKPTLVCISCWVFFLYAMFLVCSYSHEAFSDRRKTLGIIHDGIFTNYNCCHVLELYLVDVKQTHACWFSTQGYRGFSSANHTASLSILEDIVTSLTLQSRPTSNRFLKSLGVWSDQC